MVRIVAEADIRLHSPASYSPKQSEHRKIELFHSQISPRQATGFKGMEMTSRSCEIGAQPQRREPCRLLGRRHLRVGAGYISSDKLASQNIRPSTSRYALPNIDFITERRKWK